MGDKKQGRLRPPSAPDLIIHLGAQPPPHRKHLAEGEIITCTMDETIKEGDED